MLSRLTLHYITQGRVVAGMDRSSIKKRNGVPRAQDGRNTDVKGD